MAAGINGHKVNPASFPFFLMLIKTDREIIQSYFEDYSNLKGGYADRIFIPEQAEEVAAVLREANASKTPVTVSGAGTGQAGGRIPFGGLSLSTERLSRIKKIEKDKNGGVAVVEAGVVIKDLKKACEKKGLYYTYDPTEQTAFVGGTIATNASGARSFKYGSTRRCVRALKIVLADGKPFEIKRGDVRAKGRLMEFEAGRRLYKIILPCYRMPATKNSAGFYARENMDLVDLFIGQEGALGVIVEATLGLPERPRSFFSCFAFFPDEGSACDFVDGARGAAPSLIEYFDGNTLNLLREKYSNVPVKAAASAFFEDEIGDDEDAIMEKWETLLSKHGVSLDDTWVAMNEKARQDFSDRRHYIPEMMDEMSKKFHFPKIHTDLAVPPAKFREMLAFYNENLAKSALRYFVFGHIGDAHLHVNMIPKGKKGQDEAMALRGEFVKKSVSLGGTVSAEHGIGKTKKEFLRILYGQKGIDEMIAVKRVLDPNLILGRGNVFDC